MPVSLNTGSLLGVEAFSVQVEVDIQRGLPAFNVVGLPDRALQEARERVRAAIKNCDFHYPDNRITINLAPADRRKEGPNFDLPIALGVLAAQGDFSGKAFDRCFITGELALNGELRPVRGILPLLDLAEKSGNNFFIFPAASKEEITYPTQMELFPVNDLQEAFKLIRRLMRASDEVSPWQPQISSLPGRKNFSLPPIQGQRAALRAAAVAAAGRHNLMFFGPPGSGKTLIARTLPALLPPLTMKEQREVMLIASAAGEEIISHRPWRDPHHSITAAGLGGGGRSPTPGEVTLAHRGVLFLDELPEFDRRVLELLRQPLQDGYINLVRHEYNLKLPADFMMVAALNPCPCGYLGAEDKKCSCTPGQIQSYRSKLSGPLLDRIDLQIEVPALDAEEIIYKKPGKSPQEKYGNEVNEAWQRQQKRNDGSCNGQIEPARLKEICTIGRGEKRFLARVLKSLELSRRGYDIILKLARTLADMDGEEKIEKSHLAEAVQYRSFERTVNL